MDNRIVFILCLFMLFACGKKEEVEKTVPTQEEKVQEPQAKSVPVFNVTRANPFLSEEEERAFSDLGNAIPINYLNLSAIISSPSGNRAIINSQILGVGGSIDNKEIIKIEPEAVILKDAQGNDYIVRLKRIAQ